VRDTGLTDLLARASREVDNDKQHFAPKRALTSNAYSLSRSMNPIWLAATRAASDLVTRRLVKGHMVMSVVQYN
jgi:hypothetical protein